MTAYYNENDPKVADWLRELVKRGLIADGEVDERSIVDVEASDIKNFRQCHFFAGIGGWSYAIRMTGIPDEYPIWTGSCPCQPFSIAGKNKGKQDERHLWPIFFELIRQCKPKLVLGEQVSSAIKHGWLDDLCDDLERESYTTRAQVLPACSVGAPHKRDRLYWLAYSNITGLQGRKILSKHPDKRIIRTDSMDGRMGDTNGDRSQTWCETSTTTGYGNPFISASWNDPEWVYCQDKKRPIKSGIEPLADGIPARVVRLRGYGNAIVPQVAAEFIRSNLRIEYAKL